MAHKKATKSSDAVDEDMSVEDTMSAEIDTDGLEEVEGEEVVEESSADETVEPDLEAELATAMAEKNDLQDKMLRMAAELENYKKRMIRERDNALKYAGENLIKDLLPTIDNLGRALEHGPDADAAAFIEGVDMTLKGLVTTLEKAGLSPIESVGASFDPNLHEAMVMEASKDVPDQCVISEFERGYYYKDRLIRAAKVIVSKGDV